MGMPIIGSKTNFMEVQIIEHSFARTADTTLNRHIHKDRDMRKKDRISLMLQRSTHQGAKSNLGTQHDRIL